MPAIEASVRTNCFFASAVCKAEPIPTNFVIGIKISNSGLEVLDKIQITTFKFGSIYSMKHVCRDKTDYLAIGGLKSVVVLIFKDNKFTQLGEYINIHAGPVLDSCFTLNNLSTVSTKDNFIQMIGVEQYADKTVPLINRNQLEYMVPKLKSEYDSWSTRTIELPSKKFRSFEILDVTREAILVDPTSSGVTKVSLDKSSKVSVLLKDQNPSYVFSSGMNILIMFDKERDIKIYSSELLELNSYAGIPLKKNFDVPYSLKHANSESTIMWMKSKGHIVVISSNELTSQEIPPLALNESHVLIGCAASYNGAHHAMIIKNMAKEPEDLLVVIDDLEQTISAKKSVIFPNCKILLYQSNL
jgi:hypothetical protein